MIRENDSSLKASAASALALAFASFGDAFLYAFLPLNISSVGLPVAWVGVLLSINRFVRIVCNTWIVHAFATFGLRSIMILAAALAVTSTLGYGIAHGIVAWIFFRVLWGVAFSSMRIGTLAYALQHNRPAFAFGMSKGLQEAGPMIALITTPLLLCYFPSSTIFYLLATLSLPALYFALTLPRGDDRTPSLSGTRVMRWPTPVNLITLASAMLIDGIVVIVLGVLFLHYRDNMTLLAATSLAAFYLGYRRICLVMLSPAGGWIADRIGLGKMFNISMALVIVGLGVMLMGWIGTGAVIVFTFYSVHAAVTPGAVSTGKTHGLAAVAENATWRDVGAAVGTLLGGFLVSSQHLNTVMLISIFLLAVLFFIHLGSHESVLKLFYLWK